MFKIALTAVLACLVLNRATGPAGMKEPDPANTDPEWQVAYWNNMALSGTPVLEESDPYIAWNWGDGSPHTGVLADRFSARWTRQVDLVAGTYRFTATADDGVRVYVDDTLLIDEWHDHPATTYSQQIELAAGNHTLKVEYYENLGLAEARLTWWGPVPATSHGWHAEYFAGHSMTGRPALVRSDADIDFDWGGGSPAPEVPGDVFSVRWMRAIETGAGAIHLVATADDGIRVYVDDRAIIDEWYDHSPLTFSAEVTLPAGRHLVVVEYYENRGGATARVSWAEGPVTTRNWRGEYYANRWLDGSPVLVRDDADVDFTWGYGSPAAVVPGDGFSVRWTRTVGLEPGSYRFTTTTDDGVRLWVDGHLLIDRWIDQPYRTHSGVIHVPGTVPIKMEYYENAGAAAARLTWTREDELPAGAIVVDDTDAGFVKGGAWAGWRTAAEGYGGRLTWTWNNDRVRPYYNWARWYPDLAPGRYEVFCFVPERYTTTGTARYWVAHRDGFTLRRVNQSTNGERWVSLGTYWFRGSGSDYVSLADVTYEARRSRLIGFDAVRWEPR
jgi:hypothetical protein